MELYYWQAFMGNDGKFSEEINEDFLKNLYKDYANKMSKDRNFFKDFLKSDCTDFNKYCFDYLKTIDYLFREELLAKDISFYSETIKNEDESEQSNFCSINLKTNDERIRYGYDPQGYVTRDDHTFKIPKDIDGLKFNEILNIILPLIRYKKDYEKCDINALNTHIEKLENIDKLNYRGKAIRNSYVDLKIEKKDYVHNYYSEKKNKFADLFTDDSSKKIKLSASFSYDYEEPFSCTHPPVYSPVNGKVIEAKNGRIVIEQKEFSKLFDGEEVFIPYLHRLEHLHDIHVSVGAEVMFGEPIGILGGNDYNTGNKYKYLQQVSYSIYMENKYFTGQRNSIITGKALEPQNFNRLINPEEFWDNKLEIGVGYSKDDNQKEV